MPAEWERHVATWLSWPKDPNTFPGDILSKVEAAYVKMVGALSEGEEVRILVNDAKAEKRVASMLRGVERVSFRIIRTVDVWVRDYCPIYVRGRDLAVVKWQFNAWGNKYDDLKPDDAAGESVARSTGLRIFRPGIVLEGGSVDVNGSGTILTTEQCLLNPNRNPGKTRDELVATLGDYLGSHNVIWLKKGIEGDDTDGHVDDIARFVGPRSVVVGEEPDGEDLNHSVLHENLRVLEESFDERGRRLEVTRIPMPARVHSADGRLPASHLNFYVGNGVVLVPTFGGESDNLATNALRRLLPDRDVVGIDCRALIYGLGTLHCVTQQVPLAA